MMHIKDIQFTGTNSDDQSTRSIDGINSFSEATVTASICLFCRTNSLNFTYNKETNKSGFKKMFGICA